MVASLSGASTYALFNATLVTLAPLAARLPKGGPVSEDDLGLVKGGVLVVEDGVIKAAGSREACAQAISELLVRQRASLPEIDMRGDVVMPGFVDAHTHALFAGNRIADFDALIAGEKPLLGIRYTVEQTRACGIEALVAIGRRHLGLMRAHGTTTAEIKSGYALTAEGEGAMLQAMRMLDQDNAMPRVVATFCGAHALPPEFEDFDAFTDALVTDFLPVVSDLGIARFADAFCETGFFSVEQSRRFLQACAAKGMGLRIHADELAASGGAKLAAQLHCTSADHLNYIGEDDIAALRESSTTAVLCPTTAEFLGLARRAPARALIEAGVPVALATDFNPGTSPCYSLQAVAHSARRSLHMSSPEVIAGLTLYPALSLGLGQKVGALAPGRLADLVVLDTPDYRELSYFFGGNLVRTTLCGVKND
ncbi:MAG TPA: imidazolonepropionase [Candidatus Tumulicola sp.]|nr:imidazolonepropionase [Candidatus Tumulicola sp.]